MERGDELDHELVREDEARRQGHMLHLENGRED
jgi:hypothetical protein